MCSKVFTDCVKHYSLGVVFKYSVFSFCERENKKTKRKNALIFQFIFLNRNAGYLSLFSFGYMLELMQDRTGSTAFRERLPGTHLYN